MIRRTVINMLASLPFVGFFKQPRSNTDDVVMQTIGEASMCWEHPFNGGVFDSTKAEELGNRIRQHYADGIGDFATAWRRVCDDLRDDKGLLVGYRANIACLIHDRDGIGWEHAKQTADAICNLLFETNLPLVRR